MEGGPCDSPHPALGTIFSSAFFFLVVGDPTVYDRLARSVVMEKVIRNSHRFRRSCCRGPSACMRGIIYDYTDTFRPRSDGLSEAPTRIAMGRLSGVSIYNSIAKY